MNKLLLFIFCAFLFSSVEIFWDLGLGISEFSAPNHNQAIELSTFHRLEGLKKYYDNDYKTAIYHFSQLDTQDANHILYEHLDCYYILGQLSNASSLLNNYDNHTLSDNIIRFDIEKINLLLK